MSLHSPEEATLDQLSGALASGELTSVQLVQWYLDRIASIDGGDQGLHSVIETNPDALDIAAGLDRERGGGYLRGPLHGIPVLVKDNIDTGDRMHTTAGSLALAGIPAERDAAVVARLRAGGAILLGKANLSEWANFRSLHSISGWSAAGGQCRNPFAPDRSPSGSSSGSAAGVSANLAPVALGTETDGSVVSPSSVSGVVGIKPGVGVTSREGVVPISATQDTVGTHGRTVRDAALLLGAISDDGFDYAAACVPGALRGARLGVPRKQLTAYSSHADSALEATLEIMRRAGAEIVDPADLPAADELQAGEAELTVLLYEFKAGIERYLGTRPGVESRTLADLIAFNEAHADQELRWFGQEIFNQALEKGGLNEHEYLQAREAARSLGTERGIDAVLTRFNLDALVSPTGSPAWLIDTVNGDPSIGGASTPAAVAGYPLVTVPAGFARDVLPLGVTFMGTAGSEAMLIRLAYSLELELQARRPPKLRPAHSA